MSIHAATRAARATADAILFGADADQCVVTRAGEVTDPAVPDPVTGLIPAPPRVEIYRGPGRLRTPAAVSSGRRIQSAGDGATILTTVFSAPMSAPQFLIDDRVSFTASMDPDLIGMSFAVSGLIPASHSSSRRVTVTAVID